MSVKINAAKELKEKLHEITFSTEIGAKKDSFKPEEFKETANKARKTFSDEDLVRFRPSY